MCLSHAFQHNFNPDRTIHIMYLQKVILEQPGQTQSCLSQSDIQILNTNEYGATS